METQLVDLTIITFNIARGGTFEQALRVDRPPSALVFATSSSLPATQGQRSKDRHQQASTAVNTKPWRLNAKHAFVRNCKPPMLKPRWLD